MKKVLSLVLTAVMLLSMVFSMGCMQAFAADGDINLLDESKMTVGDAEGRAGSYEFLDNGALKLTATGEKGFGVTFTLNEEFTIEDLKYVQLDMSSDAGFNIAFNVTTKSGNAWPQLLTDWYPSFQDTPPLSSKGIDPVENFHQSLDMLGYFTYNDNEKMPDDGKSTVLTVSIALYAPGEMTVNHFVLSSEEEFEDVNGVLITVVHDEDTTDTTTLDADTTAADTDTTAATTTTKAATTDGGSNTVLWVVIAIVVVVVIVIVIVAVSKKKKKEE
jgi:hypothetical protein